jgi:prepilin-type N-terminal cleavage/methylation domain-containing protein
MPKKSCAKSRRGLTLAEMAIAMAITGIVLGAIWGAMGSVHEEQNDNEAVIQLKTVAHNITVLKQTQQSVFTTPFPANITSAMINAGAIPSFYVNTDTPTTANTPWRSSEFVVKKLAAKSFRISYYFPTMRGCLMLLLNGTACTSGDIECPTAVYTNNAAFSLFPGTAANWSSYSAGFGWSNMTVDQATTACSLNTDASSSVEFDYTF